jgi:pimeloyl-ACP methyl ester carboxylesterase
MRTIYVISTIFIVACFSFIFFYLRQSEKSKGQNTGTSASPAAPFTDVDFNFQFLRALDHTTYMGAQVGECVQAASCIIDGDYESWYMQWRSLADRLYATAQECERKGHMISARDAYLRASNYYRTSYFFLRDHIDDLRLQGAFTLQEQAFKKAIPYMSYHIETLTIPYSNTSLSGYAHCPAKSIDKNVLVIFPCGSDSTKEEHYFFGAQALVERGYTVITFDGPGQGEALYRKKLYFRPDWEIVLNAIIAHSMSVPLLRDKKIVLLGRSYASYFVLRAAAIDRRVIACIVDPGAWSVFDAIMEKVPVAARPMFAQYVDQIIDTIGKPNIFKLKSMAVSHGAASVHDFIEITKQYTVAPYVAQIACPILVCSAEHEFFNKGQAEKLYEQLHTTKEYISFVSSEGAGQHCEMGVNALFDQRAFDWLDNIMKTT